MTSSSVPNTTLRRVPGPRLLDAISLLCIVGALTALLWPVGSPSPQAHTSEPLPNTMSVVAADTANDATRDRARADSLVSRVVNGNVFSASRKAPVARFQLPGSASSSQVSDAAQFVAPTSGDTATTAMASGGDGPRLSGLVTMNGERRALLQLRASDGVPSLYRAGDTHAGYRVVSIGPDYVILSSRAGTRTLRLSAPAVPDSLELSR